MKLLRKISFPFMPVYYLVIWLRNWLYNSGVFRSKSYDVPVICIGNLSVGGTGKSPMVEYVVRLLKDDYKLATLSRGYKRKTEGFVLADKNATAKTIGDEPLQFFKKFDNITVAVDSNRQNGISKLLKTGVNTIILDDAFQHRKVKAGLNILLTTFNNPYYSDYVLPTGNLREPKIGASRADIIVVTKCPETISDSEKDRITKRIKPRNNQYVFFSWIEYGEAILSNTSKKPLRALGANDFVLVTGIANSKPLVDYLMKKGLKFEHFNFEDHHEFTDSEIMVLKGKNLILATEKDYMRLEEYFDKDQLFYLPIECKIDKADEFSKKVKSFASSFKKR